MHGENTKLSIFLLVISKATDVQAPKSPF